MKEKDTLLDKCVREALRLGYGVNVQRFTAMAEAKYGSIERYFQYNPAPPPRAYSSRRSCEMPDLPQKPPKPPRKCRICGKPVPHSSAHRYFDCEECFLKWDAERQRMRTQRRRGLRNPPRPCLWCGTMMPAGTTKSKKYCCPSCKEKAKTARLRHG